MLARGAGLVLHGTTLPAMKRRVLVASNRGPVSYQFGPDGTLTGRRGGGGLVAGVTSGLAAGGPQAEVSWIGAALSDADRAAAHLRPAAEEPGAVPVRMLDIPPDIFDRAYNNVANSILWFVQHMLFDTPNQPRFGREFRQDWAAYLAYNEAFAAAMADEAAEGSAPAAAAGQAGRRLRRPRHRALLAHALGAARLLPDAARGGGPGGARRHARRGPRRLSRRPVGHRVPGLLRRDPGRAGERGARRRRPGGAGAAPRARQRGGRAPAGRG